MSYDQLCRAVRKGNTQQVNFLLQEEVNPNPAPRARNSPLHVACRNNNLDIARLLITNQAHPADPNVPDDHGSTPLHIACVNNNIDIVNLLITNPVHPADPNVLDDDDVTPFFVAMFFQNVEVMAQLLTASLIAVKLPYVRADICSERLDDPLTWAVLSGNVVLVELMLQGGADPNKTITTDIEPAKSPLSLAIFQGDEVIIKLLLKYGCDPSTGIEGSVEDYLAVEWAAMSGKMDVFQLLMDQERRDASCKYSVVDNFYFVKMFLQKSVPVILTSFSIISISDWEMSGIGRWMTLDILLKKIS